MYESIMRCHKMPRLWSFGLSSYIVAYFWASVMNSSVSRQCLDDRYAEKADSEYGGWALLLRMSSSDGDESLV